MSDVVAAKERAELQQGLVHEAATPPPDWHSDDALRSIAATSYRQMKAIEGIQRLVLIIAIAVVTVSVLVFLVLVGAITLETTSAN